MSTTPHLGLPLIAAAQAQKHVTHNEALFGLDALVHLAVLDRDLAIPPASPANGARYIVAGAGVGAWAGKGSQIAAWQDGTWRFYAPGRGWLTYVIDEGALLGWDGAAWTDAIKTIAQFQNLTQLGLGTTADAVNPFSAKLNDALWTARTGAEGGTGDLRAKINKESAARTLSLLFQDGYSGRAEMGLVGDDDFRIKVSPDGAVWKEALRIDRATGMVAFPSGSPFVSGIKNLLINGNFAVNQRAYVSGAALAGGAYGHDRWKAGAGGASYTFAAAKPDTTVTITAGTLLQILEDVNIEGGTHTLSWAGTAQGRVYLTGSTAPPAFGAMPAGGIQIAGVAAGQSLTVEFNAGTLGKAQLEPGSGATPFERRFHSKETELCGRYFQKSYDAGTSPGTVTPAGAATALAVAIANRPVWDIPLPLEMRIAPFRTFYNPVSGATGSARNLSTGTDVGNLTDLQSNTKRITFYPSGYTPVTGDLISVHYTLSAEL